MGARRGGRGTLAAIAAVAVAAWALVLAGFDGGGVAGFLLAWTVMMAAMMLPSAAPLVLLYRRSASAPAAWRLAAGYLTVWALTGVAAWALVTLPLSVPAAAMLALAGVYQLTPAKRACLRRCRSPADFLVQRWSPSAFRLGLDHGVWCLGCCWALMVVLVAAGMMGLAWVAGVAGIVAAEKLLPRGAALARAVGVVLLLLAAWEGVSTWTGI